MRNESRTGGGRKKNWLRYFKNNPRPSHQTMHHVPRKAAKSFSVPVLKTGILLVNNSGHVVLLSQTVDESCDWKNLYAVTFSERILCFTLFISVV